MVNTEEFSKRLKIILTHYNISASQLAEKMNVQRSSISHILSGRNKPSLDFVMKILKTFPEVELYWLLNGTGVFPKNTEVGIEKKTPTPANQIKKQTQLILDQENDLDKQENKYAANEIERIVIFYKDGTFKNYIP